MICRGNVLCRFLVQKNYLGCILNSLTFRQSAKEFICLCCKRARNVLRKGWRSSSSKPPNPRRGNNSQYQSAACPDDRRFITVPVGIYSQQLEARSQRRPEKSFG